MGPQPDALTFYDRFAADYHLIHADWSESIARHGAVLDRLITTRLGRPAQDVLDCACGIGTQALGLAARGHRVTGSDLSAAMLARAAAEARRRDLPLRLIQADLRALGVVVPGRYDVVLALDNALAHLLDAADLGRAARTMAAKLQAGGLLLASIRDYNQALRARPTVVAPRFFDDGGRRRIVHQVWEWLDERRYRVHLHITREQAGGWQAVHHVGLCRAITRAELDGVLAAAGLVEVTWLEPAESGFFQPMVVARRPGARPVAGVAATR